MAMTLSEKRARAAERKAQTARLDAIERENAEFAARVNAAIERGVEIVIETAFGPYIVDSITARLHGHTHPAGERRDWANGREFMLSGQSLAAIRDQVGF